MSDRVGQKTGTPMKRINCQTHNMGKDNKFGEKEKVKKQRNTVIKESNIRQVNKSINLVRIVQKRSAISIPENLSPPSHYGHFDAA